MNENRVGSPPGSRSDPSASTSTRDAPAHKGATGFRRIVRAAGYSAAGLAYAWRNEAAFRQELLLLAILSPLAFWVSDDPIARILMIGSLLLVLIVELLNSAIEAAIDRISEERHPLAKAAKDIGSAAVMISLFLAGLIWSIVLLS